MVFVKRVLSFKNGYEQLLQHPAHFEIYEVLDSYINTVLTKPFDPEDNQFTKMLELWEESFISRGWLSPSDLPEDIANVRTIGPLKDGISVGRGSSFGINFNLWLFQHSIIAIRNKIVAVPCLFVPCTKTLELLNWRKGVNDFSRINRQLTTLVPLSHPYPFVVVEFTIDEDAQVTVNELEADPLIQSSAEMIDRSIEFPPEHYQAGLSILNFFGQYLRQQYPNEDAKVKIEQDGLTVRLIVESKDGTLETIEKALYEYELIVTGKELPEKVIKNELLVMELRHELRHAHSITEFYKELNHHKGQTIDRLNNLLELALGKQTNLSINVSPTITSSNQIHVINHVNNAVNDVLDLKELLSPSSNAYPLLQELEGSLRAIATERNPDIVKGSAGMSKFRRFLDKLSDGNDDITKAIKALDNGLDLAKNLAGKYNSIAEWCGLPQVPKIFTS